MSLWWPIEYCQFIGLAFPANRRCEWHIFGYLTLFSWKRILWMEWAPFSLPSRPPFRKSKQKDDKMLYLLTYGKQWRKETHLKLYWQTAATSDLAKVLVRDVRGSSSRWQNEQPLTKKDGEFFETAKQVMHTVPKERRRECNSLWHQWHARGNEWGHECCASFLCVSLYLFCCFCFFFVNGKAQKGGRRKKKERKDWFIREVEEVVGHFNIFERNPNANISRLLTGKRESVPGHLPRLRVQAIRFLWSSYMGKPFFFFSFCPILSRFKNWIFSRHRHLPA